MTDQGFVRIFKAVKVLRDGGVVAYPTDTAYGFAVDATNLKAVQKLYKLKGREFNKPIHVIFPSFEQLNVVVKFGAVAKKLVQKFFPGPITIVVPLRSKSKSWQMLAAGSGNLGFRLPDHPVVKTLIKEFGKPITTTSANKSYRANCYSVVQIKNQFKKSRLKPDYYLDGGKLKKVNPSTIILVNGNKIELLREGPISFKQIKNAI